MTTAVTVCIPTYNGAVTLGAALESLRSQRFADFDVLVVDDGSTDDTLAIAASYRDDLAIRIESNAETRGLAGNWNRCVELAEAPFVKFLFQDDLLLPDCLSAMVPAAEDVDLVICGRRARFEQVSQRRRREYSSYLRWSSLRHLVGRSGLLTADDIATLVLQYPFINVFAEPVAHLFRRSALERRRFEPTLIQLVDYDLATRVALDGGLRFIDRTLCEFRVHNAATTTQNYDSKRFELEVLDPARLAARYLSHPDYERLRAATATAEAELADHARSCILRAHRWLETSDDPADRVHWAELLAGEPALAALEPVEATPDLPSGPPRLDQRLRSWSDLAWRRSRSALARLRD